MSVVAVSELAGANGGVAARYGEGEGGIAGEEGEGEQCDRDE